MKMTRHAKIKEIIDNNKIETQEDLASALRHQGIDVTQATVCLLYTSPSPRDTR